MKEWQGDGIIKGARVTRKGGPLIMIGGSGHHRIPEAFKAFCMIVSFTAAKTSRIFVVSVACVRLRKRVFKAPGSGSRTGHQNVEKRRTVGKH